MSLFFLIFLKFFFFLGPFRAPPFCGGCLHVNTPLLPHIFRFYNVQRTLVLTIYCNSEAAFPVNGIMRLLSLDRESFVCIQYSILAIKHFISFFFPVLPNGTWRKWDGTSTTLTWATASRMAWSAQLSTLARTLAPKTFMIGLSRETFSMDPPIPFCLTQSPCKISTGTIWKVGTTQRCYFVHFLFFYKTYTFFNKRHVYKRLSLDFRQK